MATRRRRARIENETVPGRRGKRGDEVTTDHEGHLERLAEAARRRSIAVFVGAGAAKDADLPGGKKLPDWNGLIDPLRGELGLADKTDDVLDVAQWYCDAKGRDALLEDVRKSLGGATTPTPMHLAVAALPAPVFFTTNYDDLLERAIAKTQRVPPDVIIEDAHIGLIDEARRTTVVKLHGDLAVPDTIVLTRDDYEGYAERHPAMIAYLQALLATRTFLFVGFSLRDANFRQIHRQIRRALGKYGRTAYVLDGTGKESLIAKHWSSRGVTTLTFPSFDEVRDQLRQFGSDAVFHGNAARAARRLGEPEPPPSLEVQQVVDGIGALRTSLVELLGAAGLSGPIAEVAPDAPQMAGGPGAASRAWVRKKGPALLQLAEAVDRLEPIEDAGFWITLGDFFYAQGDSTNAIASYHNALRTGIGGTKMASTTWSRVNGDLARAHLAERDYSRAEWLLRRCVFKSGKEIPVEELTRQNVLRRLDLKHLKQRPMDAAEFAYAVSCRAEQMIDAQHPTEAYEALREARYVLIVLLGVGDGVKVADPASFFRCSEETTAPSGRWLRRAARMPLHPRAWALNFLGKCYRFCCEALLASGRTAGLKHHYERAVRYLRWASAGDPILGCGDRLMVYPYAHRILLHQQVPMPKDDDYPVLLDELRQLRQDPDGASVVQSLIGRFAGLAHDLDASDLPRRARP